MGPRRDVDHRAGAVHELDWVVPLASSEPLCWLYATCTGSLSTAVAASPTSNSSWTRSQSPSCLLLKSLNG